MLNGARRLRAGVAGRLHVEGLLLPVDVLGHYLVADVVKQPGLLTRPHNSSAFSAPQQSVTVGAVELPEGGYS